MLDLVGMGLTIGAIVDNEALLGVFPADLLVDLGR
jgi:hypothetical protein